MALPIHNTGEPQVTDDNAGSHTAAAWDMLQKLAFGSYPIVLAWTVWVTVQLFENKAFRERGDRFTATDALVMKAEMIGHMANLPSTEWRERIKELETNQSKMVVSMGRIEAKLEVLIGRKGAD